MEFIALWLFFAGLVAWMASARGRDPVVWFFIGLLSSLIGFLVLVFKPNLKEVKAAQAAARETAESKTCPKCAEKVKAEALVCRFCQHSFAASAPTPTMPVTPHVEAPPSAPAPQGGSEPQRAPHMAPVSLRS